MVRDIPALVITDARDLSKNSGNHAFAHSNLCPDISTCLNFLILVCEKSLNFR